MPTRKLLKSQAGATFIEAIIASIILILVLCSVLGVISHSYRYVANIRLAARGSQILQQKMEDIRLLTWTAMQELPTTFTDPNDTNGTYAGTIVTSNYDSYDGEPTIKHVTLILSWTNRNSMVTTNHLSTLVANGGLNKFFF